MSHKSFHLDFNYALGVPETSAGFRQNPEDFLVTEVFDQTLSGEGEHLYLWVEKRNENTRWVAKLLAEHFKVSESDIGYCGMKDRNAITQQWFSVYLPKHTDIKQTINLNDNIRVLKQLKHHKKLRRGDHQGNQFLIRLRNCQSNEGKHNAHELITKRLQSIELAGVPNYFGEQRFGHDANNLQEADKILSQLIQRQQQPVNKKSRGRRKSKGSGLSGIYLSAARSFVFNTVLSARIASEGLDELAKDTGPLWGRGRPQASAELQQLEAVILAPWQDWLTALEFTGLSQERRPLTLKPQQFDSQWQGNDLLLSFVLGKGEYATSILREISLLDSPEKAPVI